MYAETNTGAGKAYTDMPPKTLAPAPQPPLTERVLSGLAEARKFLSEARYAQGSLKNRVFGPTPEPGCEACETPEALEAQIAQSIGELIDAAREVMHGAQLLNNRL